MILFPSQSNVPYTTRLLVRYPTDSSKFNGTVIVEWLNDTTGGDQDPVWSEIYNQVLSQGYAYVGVTAQTAGTNELRAWDPQRYGALGDSNDGQSYDIFSQAAQVARADTAALLGGLSPARVIGAGDSQSAFRVDTYVNAVQPVSHAFDGFIAVGRSVFAAPIGSGLIAFSPAPAYVRTDNTAPFIQLNTEGDIEELGAAFVRQPDNNYLRTWEMPGAAHIDLHEGIYEGATIAREAPQLTAPVSAAAAGGVRPVVRVRWRARGAASTGMSPVSANGGKHTTHSGHETLVPQAVPRHLCQTPGGSVTERSRCPATRPLRSRRRRLRYESLGAWSRTVI